MGKKERHTRRTHRFGMLEGGKSTLLSVPSLLWDGEERLTSRGCLGRKWLIPQTQLFWDFSLERKRKSV